MNRVLLLFAVTACLFAARSSRAGQPDFHLQVVPAIVYKVDDPGNTRTSSFVFDIAVICSTDCALSPVSAHVELSSGGATIERQEWTTEMLAKIQGVHYRILADTPVESTRRMFTLPEAFDLHFYMRCPQAQAIDSAGFRVTVADAQGRRAEQMLKIPIQYYQQKTSLIVPFRGNGVVGQDWTTNGGHGGTHGGLSGADFAVDLRGLDENFAEQKNDANENAAAAGWGREIIAPAAGTVTYVRNDVPCNPRPGVLFDIATLHDPIMAFSGNCVIIDHGNSEYSVMMHMQAGSVTVKVGQRVAAGQAIGKLGNSGNSFGRTCIINFSRAHTSITIRVCRFDFKMLALRCSEAGSSAQNRLAISSFEGIRKQLQRAVQFLVRGVDLTSRLRALFYRHALLRSVCDSCFRATSADPQDHRGECRWSSQADRRAASLTGRSHA